MYNHKLKGGIGLINVFRKAKSIFTATVIRNFYESKKNDIIQYYMALRLNGFFGMTTLPYKFSYNNTLYYDHCLDIIRKCREFKSFPNVKSREIYDMIHLTTKPEIEKLYLNFNWKNIWKNLNFKYINLNDRHVVYKYIHEILPNNKRLYNMQSRQSPNCENCNIEETNIHMFLYCQKVQECVKLIYRMLYYFCNINFENHLLKLLFLVIPKIEQRIQNTICIVISSYISCTWHNKEDTRFLTYKFKAKIIEGHKYHKLILKEKMQNIFTENYSNLDPNIINNL